MKKIATPLDLALAEAKKVMRKIQPDSTHSLHVRHLARQLFFQLQPLHRLSPEDLTLLEIACLLHDIGWTRSPSGTAHHKHSAAMIREYPWKNLTVEQIDWVAQIARYHRKALPKLTHKAFRSLPLPARQKLCSSAALIRLADALDRSHAQSIKQIHCEITPEFCRLHLQSNLLIDEEILAVETKRDLFELHFSMKLETILLTAPKNPASS